MHRRGNAPSRAPGEAGRHTDGQSVPRGLFPELPDDPQAWRVDDQVLCGPESLVAPVVDSQRTSPASERVTSNLACQRSGQPRRTQVAAGS